MLYPDIWLFPYRRVAPNGWFVVGNRVKIWMIWRCPWLVPPPQPPGDVSTLQQLLLQGWCPLSPGQQDRHGSSAVDWAAGSLWQGMTGGIPPSFEDGKRCMSLVCQVCQVSIRYYQVSIKHVKLVEHVFTYFFCCEAGSRSLNYGTWSFKRL